MRAKVVALIARHDAGEICVARRGDLIAVMSHTATEAQRERADLHLAACPGCVRMVSDAAIAARRIGALLPPIPALRDDETPNRLVAIFGHVRRLLPRGGSEHADAALAAKAGAAGAAGAAGGSALASGGLAGAGALKVGIAALCAAGAVGTVAVCERAGVLQQPSPVTSHASAARHRAQHRRAHPVTAAARAPAPVTAVVAAPATTTAAPTSAPRPAAKITSRMATASSAASEFGFEGSGRSAAPLVVQG